MTFVLRLFVPSSPSVDAFSAFPGYLYISFGIFWVSSHILTRETTFVTYCLYLHLNVAFRQYSVTRPIAKQYLICLNYTQYLHNGIRLQIMQRAGILLFESSFCRLYGMYHKENK